MSVAITFLNVRKRNWTVLRLTAFDCVL